MTNRRREAKEFDLTVDAGVEGGSAMDGLSKLLGMLLSKVEQVGISVGDDTGVLVGGQSVGIASSSAEEGGDGLAKTSEHRREREKEPQSRSRALRIASRGNPRRRCRSGEGSRFKKFEQMIFLCMVKTWDTRFLTRRYWSSRDSVRPLASTFSNQETMYKSPRQVLNSAGGGWDIPGQ